MLQKQNWTDASTYGCIRSDVIKYRATANCRLSMIVQLESTKDTTSLRGDNSFVRLVHDTPVKVLS